MHNCVYVMNCRAAFAATVSALSEDTYMYSALVQCMWLVTEVDTSEATRLQYAVLNWTQLIAAPQLAGSNDCNIVGLVILSRIIKAFLL